MTGTPPVQSAYAQSKPQRQLTPAEVEAIRRRNAIATAQIQRSRLVRAERERQKLAWAMERDRRIREQARAQERQKPRYEFMPGKMPEQTGFKPNWKQADRFRGVK